MSEAQPRRDCGRIEDQYKYLDLVEAFNAFLSDAPGSPYRDAKAETSAIETLKKGMLLDLSDEYETDDDGSLAGLIKYAGADLVDAIDQLPTGHARGIGFVLMGAFEVGRAVQESHERTYRIWQAAGELHSSLAEELRIQRANGGKNAARSKLIRRADEILSAGDIFRREVAEGNTATGAIAEITKMLKVETTTARRWNAQGLFRKWQGRAELVAFINRR